MTPKGKLGNCTLAYFAAFICHGLVISILGPTLPHLAKQTGVALDQISILFITRSLGYLVGALTGSRLYDRFRGHPIVAATLVINAIALVAIPSTPHLWVLASLLFILGVSEATLDVGINTLIIWVHGRKVAPFMNALHFFFGLGALVTPIIIAQTLRFTGGISWGYWALVFVLLPVAAWIFKTPSPIAQHADQKPHELKKDHLLVVLVALLFFLYVGAEIAFGGWVYTYAIALNLANEQSAAYLTSAFWGAFTIGRLLSIAIAMKFRPRYVLMTDFAGCLTGLVLVLLFPSSRMVLWAGAMLVGVFMASIFPTILAVAERRMTVTGKVTGWFFVGASCGAMFLPTFIGQFFESIGPRVMMLAIMASVLAALGVALLFLHKADQAENNDKKS